MKKYFLNVLLTVLMVFTLSTSAMALSMLSLDNWAFNPNGTGYAGSFGNLAQITFYGISAVDSNVGVGNNGSFDQYGTYNATAFTKPPSEFAGYTNVLPGVSKLGVDYELTLELDNTKGTFVVNSNGINEVTFTQAALNIYIDSNFNYGQASADPSVIYGGNDGTLIASFLLISGNGTMNFNANAGPDGSTNITFLSNPDVLTNGFRPGYWFDEDGIDLSTYDPTRLPVLSITDSNNELFVDAEGNNLQPDAVTTSEFTKSGLQTAATPDFENFFVQSDGSFSLATTPIPEPATLILFGAGLVGLGYTGRKKMMM